MKRYWLFISAFTCGLLALASWTSGTPAAAQTTQRCFPETNQCISGRIREYWEQNGGLPVFGYPVTPQQQQTIEGKPLQVQWFQRNRLELHPENARPYDVLLGRLGVDALAQQGRDWQTFPKSAAQGGCRFFAETGQNVCGDILAAWRKNGLEFDGVNGKSEAENLALFGLPVSPLQAETLSDGKQYQVQWFERARFELHPENAAPYNVLLGLLGNELLSGGGNVGGATATPAAPTATPGPTPKATPDANAAGVPAQIDLDRSDAQRRPGCNDRDGDFEIRKLTAGNENIDLAKGFLIKAPVAFPICLDGFGANQRVKIQVTRPDGTTRTQQIRVNKSGDGLWYFAIEPDDTLGLFNITATDEDGNLSSGTVQVINTDSDDERIVPVPREASQGDVIRVYLAGFTADRSVKLHVYRIADNDKANYVNSLPSLKTDDDGAASIRLGTDAYAPGTYAIGRFVDNTFEPFQLFEVDS